jgi:hypothetical protein
LPAALAGKAGTVLGDPDQPHTYTYIPDIGVGLAVLGEHPEALGHVWHPPSDPNTHTTRQLVDLVFELLSQPRTRLRQVKPLLIRVAAPSAEVCIRAACKHTARPMSGLTICLRRDFTEGAAPSSHPGTTFAALGRDSRASALAGRSSADQLVFAAA